MKWSAVLTVFLLAITSTAYPASRNSQVTRELTAEYATYVKAFANKNLAPIEAQLDPGWSGRMRGQTMSRAQLLNMTDEAMQATRAVKDMCILIKSVSVKGNVATATVTDTASLVVWNEDGETTRNLATKNLRRDTWVKRAGDWKLRRSEILKVYY